MYHIWFYPSKNLTGSTVGRYKRFYFRFRDVTTEAREHNYLALNFTAGGWQNSTRFHTKFA